MIPLLFGPMARVAVVAGALFVTAWWGHHVGYKAEHERRIAEVAAIKLAATQKALDDTNEARRLEQARRKVIQEAEDAKNEELRRVGARLNAAIVELRGRADRAVGMPEAGRKACAGANGAELSRPDASFLVGEAARADALRAELAACQQSR